MTLESTPLGRKQRADESLLGLSVGDAFGQQIFRIGMREWCLENKQPPPPLWEYTDDTEMAIAICDILERHPSAGCLRTKLHRSTHPNL